MSALVNFPFRAFLHQTQNRFTLHGGVIQEVSLITLLSIRVFAYAILIVLH